MDGLAEHYAGMAPLTFAGPTADAAPVTTLLYLHVDDGAALMQRYQDNDNSFEGWLLV